MRRLLGLCMAAVCLFSLFSLTVRAEAAEFPEVDNAGAVSLWHVESGRSVGRKNDTVRRAAGASVKLLSGLVACEWLEGQLDGTVIVTDAMIGTSAGKRYGLENGNEYSWREILLLALCGSYNDAYDVIAYSIGNGEEVGSANFVGLLNARAKELGALSTVVGDPSGVGDNSYTTAADLLLIAQAAMRNELYLSFTGLRSGQLSTGDYVWNRNALVTGNTLGSATCAGMCVGETNHAGVTLVALIRRGNDSYLLVLMGTADGEGNASETATNSLAVRLIRWAYANYTNTEVLSPDMTVCTLPVTVSDMKDTVAVRPATSLWAYLPAGSEVGRDVLLSIRLNVDELEAPVAEGTPVGFVAAVWNGEIIGKVPLETAENADRSGFMSRLLSIRNLTKSRRAKAGVIFFVLCMAVWIGGGAYLKYRRRAKWHQYYSSKSKWK